MINTDIKILQKLSLELNQELQDGILPFWMEKMIDHKNGGFFGRIDGNNTLHNKADKGVILTARILWAFSAAYRLYKDPKYLQIAQRANDYLLDYFWDELYGGVFWKLDFRGIPVDTKKQINAQGFALYGLSEYYRVSGSQRSLDKACELLFLIEKYAFDNKIDGYLEVFTRRWELIDESHINEDFVAPITTNTHLHIIEPYSNLYSVFPSYILKKRINHLLDIFTDKIIDLKNGHLQLYFDKQWNSIGSNELYGIDIQAIWLLEEAAKMTGDEKQIEAIHAASLSIASVVAENIDSDGGLINEYNIGNGYLNKEKCWWVQAEAMVGFFKLYQNTRNSEYLQIVLCIWEFIKKNLIDKQYGEWYWSILPDGKINRDEDKAGIWKCPYHNSRMCIELIERIKTMQQEHSQNK